MFRKFVCLLFLLSGGLHGQEEELEAPPGYPGREPDHLVPVTARDTERHEAYRHRLDQEFQLGDFAFARMIRKGSAEIRAGESVFCIHGGPADRDPARTEKFYLTRKIADRNVWYAIPQNSNDQASHEVKIRTITVPLDKPLALRLIKLWDRMLERVAERDWKKFPNGTLDGGTYVFSTPGKTGEYLRAPYNRTSTGIFAGLGDLLMEYGNGMWNMHSLTLKKIEAQAAKLETYLDEHPAPR